MTKYQAPNVPFVEARLTGSKHRPTAITLDISMTTSDKGAALGIANLLHKPNGPTRSHHYLVDEAEIYRGVWDNIAAVGSYYRSLSIMVCAQPHEEVAMWEDATAKPVLSRTADLVADLILRHKIRPRYLDTEGVTRWLQWRRRGNGGIIVRAPGTWPYESFLADVKARIKQKSS